MRKQSPHSTTSAKRSMPKSRPSRKEVKGIIQSLPGRHYLTNHRHLEMEQKADASNPLYGLELDSSSCRSIIYKEDLACVFFFRHFPNIFVEIFPSCLLPRIDSLSVVKKRKREREREREEEEGVLKWPQGRCCLGTVPSKDCPQRSPAGCLMRRLSSALAASILLGCSLASITAGPAG